ncbi:pilus assembly protein TadG-related protein [Streptomyces sp. MBT42]|uniref:pilus assembly protein TadG-related protein n=1 Tax=Streptomyces sp. MBT42 TaxID=1488373 RepID=UPI001E4E50CC|nr:pilus assembly protein TadG-related protein [Streptomyces sp. MBT42]MCD2464700.1 pilus assembly protein TadG-related protein [Streptomyces sp. MBT42]
MTAGSRRDSGQAFPVYIAVVAALLFLAFAYFVVGQAGALRNNAQTAADAAALAAAEDARTQLREGWLGVVLDPGQWDRFVEGTEYESYSACQQAAVFAAKNDGTLAEGDCARLAGQQGFSVTVRTQGSVGLPGTEARNAVASATALIEPRCNFTPPEEPGPDETAPDPAPTEPEEEPEPEPEPIGLTCGDEVWTIDPGDPVLPSAVDLFTVRLAGDDE